MLFRSDRCRGPQLAINKQICEQVSRGSAGDYQVDEQAGIERLTDLAVVPREKPHTGAAAREQPRDSPVIDEQAGIVRLSWRLSSR